MSNAQEILREAAEYIGEHGWCQGRARDDDGRVCAIGAISEVASRRSVNDRVLAIETAEARLSAYVGGIVPDWNDAQDRTAEDVILAMKRAAEEEN